MPWSAGRHRPLADGVHLNRTDRLCLVCKSSDYVEDEQHFVFDCPAYSHIRSQHLDLLQHCCTIADFIGSKSCLYEFTELNFLSVGSQLPPRTLNILIY